MKVPQEEEKKKEEREMNKTICGRRLRRTELRISMRKVGHQKVEEENFRSGGNFWGTFSYI